MTFSHPQFEIKSVIIFARANSKILREIYTFVKSKVFVGEFESPTKNYLMIEVFDVTSDKKIDIYLFEYKTVEIRHQIITVSG